MVLVCSYTLAGAQVMGQPEGVAAQPESTTQTQVQTQVQPEQNTQQGMPLTTRIGNSYMVNGQTMNKRAYQGYLQNTCPEAFAKFSNGLTLANVGWGLFAGGLALDLVGCCMMLSSPEVKDGTTRSSSTTQMSAQLLGGYMIGSLGGALEIASIPCLAVGYSRMHGAADLYNAYARTGAKPYLTLNAGANGIGLCYHF